MLNVTKVLEFTEDEEKYIKGTLLPQISIGNDPWDDQKQATKDLKCEIQEFLEIEQDGRCVFCEMALARKGKHIEHYVARHIINEYAYEPMNLFLSCPSCNSRAIKNDKDIIVEPGNSKVYEMNIFLVVHPYLHNPDDHIRYTDERRVIFKENACTPLGLNTIRVFKWNEKDAIKDRAEAYISRKYAREVQDIVMEASLYPTQNHLNP